jgi:hypothetical protein
LKEQLHLGSKRTSGRIFTMAVMLEIVKWKVEPLVRIWKMSDWTLSKTEEGTAHRVRTGDVGAFDHSRIFCLHQAEKEDDGDKPGQTGTLCWNRSRQAALRREPQERLESNHHENWVTGRKVRLRRSHKHSLRNGRNGDTPIGYLGRAALAREWCGIFAWSINCGARETAVGSKQLWNNICFLATATKQTTEQHPLLGIRFLISNNWTATEEQCFLCGPCWDIITRTVWGSQSVAIMLSWKSVCEAKTSRTCCKLEVVQTVFLIQEE